MSESEEYIEYTENYGKIEPDLNINTNTTIVMCDVHNNCNQYQYHKDNFLKILKELYSNNGYIIHEIDYIPRHDSYTSNNDNRKIFKIYIDNFGNSYIYGIRKYGHNTNTVEYTYTDDIKKIYMYKLSIKLIDLIKKIKIPGTEPNELEDISEKLCNIQILSEDNHKKNNYHEKISVLIKENEELKAKLDEQIRLNDNINKKMLKLKEKCKEIFELKDELTNFKII